MSCSAKPTPVFARGAAALLGCSVVPALAQPQENDWQFTANLYGYETTLSGSATFRTGFTENIRFDPNELLPILNLAFMGDFAAQRGRWGLFTDITYLDASGSRSKPATQSLSIGGFKIPPGITASASLDLKSTAWTLGASYRVATAPPATFDLLAGARDLALKQHLSWEFAIDIGPFVGPTREGSTDSNTNNWDGIIGAKGRLMFGEEHGWFVPYYVDVGTGASHLTWQALAGIGYTFRWGEVLGVWKYLGYHFSKDNASLSLNGPAIGVAFHF